MLRGSMPAMNQKVFSIAPGSVILTIVILVGAYTLWFLRDLVLLVLTAIVLASAIEPGVSFFVRYRLPRIVLVLLLYVIVLSFYFAVQETGVENFLRLVMPARHEEYVVGLWRRAQRKIGLWMQGQLLLSLIAGVIIYLGLLIMGVPYALL